MAGIFQKLSDMVMVPDEEDLKARAEAERKEQEAENARKQRAAAQAVETPSVVRSTPVRTVISTAPVAVSQDDRSNALNVLMARVFIGDTPYVDYRATMDALADAILDLAARRKAALKVVAKKHGREKVLAAIGTHRQQLETERQTFERSVSPEQGGVIPKLESAVQAKADSIEAKEAQIAELTAEIDQLRQEKVSAEAQIAEEKEKQKRARTLFESAYQTLSEEIAADEQLLTTQP